MTIAQQLHDIAQSYRELLLEDAVHDKELDAFANQLDARAELVLVADPDQNEIIAISIGDPEGRRDPQATNIAQGLRKIAQAYRDLLPGEAVHDGELDALAEQLDERAALLISADPDEHEEIALSLGDPESDLGGHDRNCASGVCSAKDLENCPFRVCDCRNLPANERATGHHPDCPWWDHQASTVE